jgi:hypothetical protein
VGDDHGLRPNKNTRKTKHSTGMALLAMGVTVVKYHTLFRLLYFYGRMLYSKPIKTVMQLGR